LQEILGRERRRRWSDEEKARIVAESFRDGVSVSWVARRHGLSPSQLFAWRKAAQGAMAPQDPPPALLPVEIADGSCEEPPASLQAYKRAEIAFPNGRHLFVSPMLDRRLLAELIASVAAA
jgi:transposase